MNRKLIALMNKFGTADSEYPYKIPAMVLIRLLDIGIKNRNLHDIIMKLTIHLLVAFSLHYILKKTGKTPYCGGKGMEKNNTKLKNRQIKTVVEGIITAGDWDDDGTIRAIRILTTDEDEYLVENGDLFMNLMQKSVQASGITHMNKYGEKTIHIKKISVLGNEFGEDITIQAKNTDRDIY